MERAGPKKSEYGRTNQLLSSDAPRLFKAIVQVRPKIQGMRPKTPNEAE